MQDELDKMRGKRHNDYEGSLRGGLPHGFGKKIYLNYQQWKGDASRYFKTNSRQPALLCGDLRVKLRIFCTLHFRIFERSLHTSDSTTHTTLRTQIDLASAGRLWPFGTILTKTIEGNVRNSRREFSTPVGMHEMIVVLFLHRTLTRVREMCILLY